MAIDPSNITNFNQTDEQLERFLYFWVLAAGKNGMVAARLLEDLLNTLSEGLTTHTPFQYIQRIQSSELAFIMREVGIGCYNIKSQTLKILAHANLNLRTCSVSDLEAIKGIGPKTARGFLIHSRPNQSYACLDRHLLHFLRDQGHSNIPIATPASSKQYQHLEQLYLSEVAKSGKTVAELDLEVWNRYRTK